MNIYLDTNCIYNLLEPNIFAPDGWLEYECFLLGPGLFSGAVSCREGNTDIEYQSIDPCSINMEYQNVHLAYHIPPRFMIYVDIFIIYHLYI